MYFHLKKIEKFLETYFISWNLILKFHTVIYIDLIKMKEIIFAPKNDSYNCSIFFLLL